MMNPKPYHSILSSQTLSMATRVYYIQSEIFHIPDQFGFFSSGPPPRQEFEVERVITLLVLLSILTALELVAPIVSLLTDNFHWGFFSFCLGINCLQVGFFWALACCGPLSDPEFDWGSWEIEER